MRISDWSSDVCSSDLVAIGKVLLCERRRAAGALGDILPRHLDVNAAGASALGRAEGEEGADFGEDAGHRAGLVAVGRFDRVAMHRIAGPEDRMTLPPGGAEERGKGGLDAVMAHAGAERDATGPVVRSEEQQSELQSPMSNTYNVSS